VFSAPLPPELTALARLAMGLATGAGAALLLAAVAPLRGTRQAVTGAVLGLVLGLAAASDHTRLLQITALAAAVVFPALALLGLVDVSGGETAVGGRGPGIASALVLLARVSLLTLAGAALTAGMLSDPGFMLKTRVFAGIKAATALPILLAAAAAITGATAGCETWSDQRQATAARLRSFLAEPVRVWQAAAVLAAGAALALLILRTGNDAGVGVSDLELRFRGLLDRILGVRPRTKEFLVGHPAMLLGLFLLARAEWRRWSVPFLLVGMIGQVGMLNSFCHLHTPILVTILRTINGLWVGALLGLAVVWPVRLSSRAAGCE
jgi:hypothetical protein